MSIDFILIVAACICFGLATANVKTPINLVALGLLLWALTALIK
jgi:hypothetical protein